LPPDATVGTMADLAAEQFVGLTTFRRDGTPVGTALWIVEDGSGTTRP
jgi:uncharacterized protein